MDSAKKDHGTEPKIREAARKVFLAKGLAGARMQDIADEAGINKALLHYYYQSKERLFQLIYEEELNRFFSNLQEIIKGEISLFDKIRRLIESDIEYLQSCPRLPVFLLNELTQEKPCVMIRNRHIQSHELFIKFREAVMLEIRAGKIRKVDPEHLFVNLTAMIVYPFIAKPIIMNLFNFSEQGFSDFIQNQKKECAEFILNSLRPDADEWISNGLRPSILNHTL